MGSKLEEMLKNDPSIIQFMEEYERLSKDPSKRDEYISYAKGIYYFNGLLRCFQEEGREIGLAIAELEDREGITINVSDAQLAEMHNLYKLGIKAEEIVKSVFLPLETIQNLSSV
jgi:hypothetical protein